MKKKFLSCFLAASMMLTGVIGGGYIFNAEEFELESSEEESYYDEDEGLLDGELIFNEGEGYYEDILDSVATNSFSPCCDIEGDVLKLYSGEEDTVIIPDGVREIGEGAFKGNNFIKYVILPDSVEIIRTLAFADCSELEEIVVGPESKLNIIEEDAFIGSEKLKALEVGGIEEEGFSDGGELILDDEFYLDDTFDLTEEETDEFELASSDEIFEDEADGSEESEEDAIIEEEENVVVGVGISEDQEIETVEEDALTIGTEEDDVFSASVLSVTAPADYETTKGANAVFTVVATGGTEPYTYQWQYRANEQAAWANTNVNGAKTAKLDYKVSSTAQNGRNYHCIVTDATGTSVTSDYAVLTVNEPMSLTAPEDYATIKGGYASFSVVVTGGTAPYRYQWQYRPNEEAAWANTGVNGAKTAELNYKVSSTVQDGRNYRCVVWDAVETRVISDYAVLTVSEGLSVTAPEDYTTVQGENAIFSVVATGGIEPYTYQWQYRLNENEVWHNTAVSGAKSNSIDYKVSSTAQNGRQYRCVVKDADGTRVDSAAATLTVVDVLRVTDPEDYTTVKGNNAVFSVTVTGGLEPYTYQWQYRPNEEAAWAITNVSGSKSNKIDYKVSSTAQNGRQYHCIVTDARGTIVESGAATLTVTDVLRVTAPEDYETVAGERAVFSVEATGGTAPYTYQWQYRLNENEVWHNTAVSGAKTNTIDYKVSSAAQNGRQYRCVVKDSNDVRVDSAPATLTVREPEVIINSVKYQLCDGIMTVIGYDEELESYTVEKIVSNYNVTAIGEEAFYGNTTITSIILPNEITVIGKRAFAQCTNLSSMTTY